MSSGVSGPLIFLAAGEPSGDLLGAALMRGLIDLTGGAVRFAGVGGPAMQAEGLRSLFPQDDLAVMGLVEVLPRLPAILRRIRHTAESCVALRPDALVTIDSPGFGLRVARKVRGLAPAIRTIHYVAPSVWAWKPGRARRMAACIDHVLALLPFEPPYFTPHGMTCDFVGHPAAARLRAPEAEIAALRAAAGAAPGAPLLLALPGSRMGEVRRHCAPMGAALAILRARFPDLRVVLPTVAGVADAVAALAADWPVAPLILDPRGRPQAESDARKWAAFCAADAALAASGTVALELAAARTPMVSIYRAHPITAAIVRRLVRVDTGNLVNLVAGEKVVPEFFQERLRPEPVAAAVAALLSGDPAGARQRDAMAAVVAQLGGQGDPPGLRAARSVLGALAPR
jgi:lipid-A-disaccharide synthase